MPTPSTTDTQHADFRRRVAVYAYALSDDRTPGPYGITNEERAGGLYDRLPSTERDRVAAVLNTLGVRL